MGLPKGNPCFANELGFSELFVTATWRSCLATAQIKI